MCGLLPVLKLAESASALSVMRKLRLRYDAASGMWLQELMFTQGMLRGTVVITALDPKTTVMLGCCKYLTLTG